jgi:hypothetical protein
MNAAFHSKDADAHAKEILAFLQDFEKKYPEQREAFAKVARMRLVAAEKAGRFVDLEKEVDNIFTRFTPDQQKDLLAGLDKVLPNDVKMLEKQNDKENLLSAKRTLARLYADRLQRGEPFAADESPQRFKYELAQMYLDVRITTRQFLFIKSSNKAPIHWCRWRASRRLPRSKEINISPSTTGKNC